MPHSSLFGRRIHIAGSISDNVRDASESEVRRSRAVVELLVKDLLQRGATFVVPVDAEKLRPDGMPICFDWLVWKTLHSNLHLRPAGAPTPLVVAVKHHKNEDQIPDEFCDVWRGMCGSALVQIENAAQWNMNSKRMDFQARHGEILLTLGGSDGVLYLANLYHDAGKPVIPLNFKLCPDNSGSRKLIEYGLSGKNAQRLFQMTGDLDSHGWLNRIDTPAWKDHARCAGEIISLLEALRRPEAFVVRLLNPKHPEFNDVHNYFATVVQPVMEGELGYKLTVVDGKQPFEFSRIDHEIFAKLHRSHVVVADITGQRPNCFLELGYAFGRGLPTMLLAKDGTEHPFDISSFGGHHWKTGLSVDERRREFREHWAAIKCRPPLVPVEALIP